MLLTQSAFRHPQDNYACIDKYPHLKNLFFIPTILSWSRVDWAFRQDDKFSCPWPVSILDGFEDRVYVEPIDFKRIVVSQIAVQRGECKGSLHFVKGILSDELHTGLDLVQIAFVYEKLRKFSGIITTTSYNNALYSIELIPDINFISQYTESFLSLYKKIYKS